MRLGVPLFSPITSTGPALHSVAENMMAETRQERQRLGRSRCHGWDGLRCPKPDREKQGWDLDSRVKSIQMTGQESHARSQHCGQGREEALRGLLQQWWLPLARETPPCPG